MVLRAQLNSPPLGYVQPWECYAMNNGAGYPCYVQDDYRPENAYYYSNGLSMQLMRPYPSLTSPQPPTHQVVVTEGYDQNSDGYRGKPHGYDMHSNNDGYYGNHNGYSAHEGGEHESQPMWMVWGQGGQPNRSESVSYNYSAHNGGEHESQPKWIVWG